MNLIKKYFFSTTFIISILILVFTFYKSELIYKEVKRLCKEFGFTTGKPKGALAEGWKKQ